MRIHLVMPGGDASERMSFVAIRNELHHSFLLSYAFSSREPAYSRIWESLINHVQSTRNP